MPKFSNRPPRQDQPHGFRLIRTPAAGPLRAIVLSENVVGCPTHFVGNRTIPCEAPDCQPCSNGIAWRWHGYLFVQTQPAREQCIFEFTATASDAFTAYHKRYGTLRGCLFLAERINRRPNGRVLIQTKPADLSGIELPKAQPLDKLLCHIWNISPQQIAPNPPMTRPPMTNLIIDRDRPELAQTARATDPLRKPRNGKTAKPPSAPTDAQPAAQP